MRLGLGGVLIGLSGIVVLLTTLQFAQAPTSTPAAPPAPAIAVAEAAAAPPARRDAERDVARLIPYERFTLPNGLRVVVHTDRKAPVVAVGVWYHVGSKDERPGRTGFAHLFEHLMFQGTENFKGEWFEPFEKVGATNQNGTTWLDRTNYYQTVPTPALDMALWMESDRMGHFIDSVDQAKLDEQRDVVKNEKRQGENRPYGRVWEQLQKGLFPPGHPYSWTTIGSMEDLEAATLEDVRTWFATWYGPNNAVLVLAGDIDTATARPLVEKYFGDIPAGPNLARDLHKVPDRQANTRSRIEDRVPQPLLSRAWAVPGIDTRDSALLDLAAQVLGGGKTSRLYKELVYDRQIATSASTGLMPFELASLFSLSIMPKPGQDPAEAEAVAEQVIARFLETGPTREELDRVKTIYRASLVKGIEEVGGKMEMLAEGELYHGNPGQFATWMRWVEEATVEEVTAVARDWLRRGWHQVDVVPVPVHVASGGGADRSGLPAVAGSPDLTFPAIETATLSNGIPVSFARRDAVPSVTVSLMFDAGYAADPRDRAGLSSLTMALLDEGTASRDALGLAAEIEGLGASLWAGSALDMSDAGISSLRETLTPALAVLADVVRNPAFPAEEIERIRSRWLTGIQQEKANPRSLARRLLPPALYGPDHPYGKPLTGSGTEASIQALTREDLLAFHRTWIRPDTVRIFAVGDITLPELVAELETAFGGWAAPDTPRGTKTLATVAPRGGRVAIVNRPGAEQSVILAGRLGPANAPENEIPLFAANDIYGGMFTSRINMNLREEKGWSYGVGSFLMGALGQQPWIISAPVQSDRTGEALAELKREAVEFTGSRAATVEEITKVVESNTRSLPGQFETAWSVLSQMHSDALYGRPADYITGLKARYEALRPEDIAAAAKDLIRTDDLLWVIIGDRARIEAQVRGAGLGPVEIWDEDGRVIE